MRILLAFGFIPVLVFYVTWVPGGFTPLVFILINERLRLDEGLHMHELEHAEQAYRLLLLPHMLLYMLSKRYRLWAEVRAYRRQIAQYGTGANIEFAVKLLVDGYHLDLTETKARELLLTGS